jgi:hypothetical protein
LSPWFAIYLDGNLLFDDDFDFTGLTYPCCIAQANTDLSQMESPANRYNFKDAVLTAAWSVTSKDMIVFAFFCQWLQIIDAINSSEIEMPDEIRRKMTEQIP